MARVAWRAAIERSFAKRSGDAIFVRFPMDFACGRDSSLAACGSSGASELFAARRSFLGGEEISGRAKRNHVVAHSCWSSLVLLLVRGGDFGIRVGVVGAVGCTVFSVDGDGGAGLPGCQAASGVRTAWGAVSRRGPQPSTC